MSRSPAPWRAWYKTAAWQVARWRRFVVDRFTCQRCGHCEAANRAIVDALSGEGLGVDEIAARMTGTVRTRFVCDHDRAHRGSERLFWDRGNHRTMCKACHDGAKQAEEQASLVQRGVWY